MIVVAALPLLAQYPGQYPPGGYPPGGYPPGGYPPDQYPGRYPRYPGDDPSRRTPRSRGPASSRRGSKAEEAIITTTYGILRRYAPNLLVIQADDHRIVWYRITDRTTFRKEDKDVDPKQWQLGDQIQVDSTSDTDDHFTATAVRYDKEGTAEDRAEARANWDLPHIASAAGPASAAPAKDADGRPRLHRNDQKTADAAAANPKEASEPPAQETAAAADDRPTTTMRPPDAPSDPDDPGPPVLRRGVPKPHRHAASESGAASGTGPAILTKSAPEVPPAVAKTPEPPPETPQEDELIQKAKNVAASYVGSLPNFFCAQTTTRYQTEDAKRGWDALDVVTADVAYEDGHESYKNIKVGGKAVKSSMDEIGGGSTSTGEFNSILMDLLSPATAAIFHRGGSDNIAGRVAVTFRYEVPRERSHWRVELPSQLYYPAYKGTVWIDKETGRALRIEMQGRSIPQLFPLDTVETAIDYESVRLAATQSFLLPTDAEVLSCQRSSNYCTRNRIEFRNYRKFGAQSDITYEDK